MVPPLTAGGSEEGAEPRVRFAREVLPILSNKCFVCHGPDGEEDLVRLDTYAAATTDLGGYRAIDPANPSQSEMLHRIHSADDPMPPSDAQKQLTPAERELLTRWIRQGGQYEVHWSFRPPTKESPDVVPRGAADPSDPSQVVDAFVRSQLQSRGHDFAPIADRPTLARRIALVLTGLPPEPAALKEFLADERPDAVPRFVDQMLASPRYGEHQARYWLDAVRYGDTHGLHLDNRRGIYPYRDWVIRALNRNLPLDDFIVWQLAGDMLPDPQLDQLVATGFVRLNPSTSEGGAIPEEFQAKNSFDRTETLGTVFLGLSLTCARCHTHKYDPITHEEYYRLLAFFNNTQEQPLDGNKYDYAPTIQAPPDLASWDQWEQLRDEPENRAELEKQFVSTLIAKELETPRPTRLLQRGEYHLPTGDPLQPDVPAAVGRLPDDLPRNRLGLARWLVSRDNPLVSRVLVNRIWQRVFGYGLVRTPEEFGLQGAQPTHPELLDWLAVELQDSGWDLKHMLRLLVLSGTFQQSSAWRSDLEDPENLLFGRGPSHRLDAEVIRDMGLWASGLLDPQMGGEGVKPYQPAGLWSALAHPASNTGEYVADHGNRLYRRSIYVYWKRTSPHPMMTLFDSPSRESSCVRRSRTNTSLQSLGLLNETQRVEMARKLAERALHSADNDPQRLATMFELLACRAPTAVEQEASARLLKTLRARYDDRPSDAVALLSIGEAACDSTLNALEHAAWTQLASTVLASDLTIMLY
jgi:hypothetical protein